MSAEYKYPMLADNSTTANPTSVTANPVSTTQYIPADLTAIFADDSTISSKVNEYAIEMKKIIVWYQSEQAALQQRLSHYNQVTTDKYIDYLAEHFNRKQIKLDTEQKNMSDVTSILKHQGYFGIKPDFKFYSESYYPHYYQAGLIAQISYSGNTYYIYKSGDVICAVNAPNGIEYRNANIIHDNPHNFRVKCKINILKLEELLV